MIPLRKTGRRNDHFRLPPDRPGCPTRLSCVLPGQVLPWSGDSQGSRFFFGLHSTPAWKRVNPLWRAVNNGGEAGIPRISLPRAPLMDWPYFQRARKLLPSHQKKNKKKNKNQKKQKSVKVQNNRNQQKKKNSRRPCTRFCC